MKTAIFLVGSFCLLGSISEISAAPAGKAKANPHRNVVTRATASSLKIIQSQSVGHNGRQIGVDRSVHHQTINHNNHYRKTINYKTTNNRTINIYPTRTVKAPDGTEFSFAIYPASPAVADDPLHIPFVLVNDGRKSVYNLKCVTGFGDVEREGMSIKGGTFSDNSPVRSVFGPNDHIRIQVVPDDITLMRGGAVFTIGGPPAPTSPPVMTTADISFILTYSLQPDSQVLKRKYKFSLTNNGKRTWDWSRE